MIHARRDSGVMIAYYSVDRIVAAAATEMTAFAVLAQMDIGDKFAITDAQKGVLYAASLHQNVKSVIKGMVEITAISYAHQQSLLLVQNRSVKKTRMLFV